jgi:transcriptional antiterminator RfaH
MSVIPQTYADSAEPAESRWCLVHSKPRGEKIALTNLIRQGFELYFPEVATRVRTRGRWIERVAPLFPRYLFLRFAPGRQALGPIRSTLGVSGIVSFGNEYAHVPARVISCLRNRAEAATGLHRLADEQPLSPGAAVRIVAGAFDGLEGIFVRKAGDDRVVVLLDMLGAATQVRVPTGCVESKRIHGAPVLAC